MAEPGELTSSGAPAEAGVGTSVAATDTTFVVGAPALSNAGAAVLFTQAPPATTVSLSPPNLEAPLSSRW